MSTYTIHPEKSYRSFSIYQDNTLLVSVIFTSLLSRKAEVLLNGKTYKLLPTGWWWKDMQLVDDNIVVATLQYNSVKTSVVLKGEGPTGWFAIKKRNFFSLGFNLLNARDVVVAEVVPRFGIRTTYNLSVNEQFKNVFESHIGLLMLVYHCRRAVRKASSAY